MTGRRPYITRLTPGTGLTSVLVAVLSLSLTCCNTIDSDRIPNYAVNLNLTPLANWQTYGVTYFGQSRTFIRELRQPSNFPWLERTMTGYGGILLVCGMDPFSTEANVPLAYDLACPVECNSSVRVAMVDDQDHPMPVAQCPVCKSRYDVIEGGGRPISGQAKADNYGLRMYVCLPAVTSMGGYLVTNK